MGGNKHKNGIVCMYPGCEKTMRTQKFKLHFTKQHLKPGEVYTVEHRRRFEVARDEEYVSDTSSPHPLEQHLPIAVQIPPSYPVPQAPPTTVATAATANAAANAAATAGSAQVGTPSGGCDTVATAVAVITSTTANKEASAPAVTLTTTDSTDAHAAVIADTATPQRLPRANSNQPRSSDGRFGYTSASYKRPASAIESAPAAVAAATTARADASATAAQGKGQQQVGDLSRAVLIEYIEMMNQRFHELIQKMGQVIDGQRELIDMLRRPFPAETAQLLEQTPSLAPPSQSPENLAPAADSSAKKRRKSNSSADLQAPNGGTMSLL